MSEMNKRLHVFKVDYEITDWVVAYDEADALDVWGKHQESNGFRTDEFDPVTITQEPDDFVMSVREDEATDEKPAARKPASEWAAENGRGFLASSEW